MENPRLLRLIALDESGCPVEMNEVNFVYFSDKPVPSIHVEASHFKNTYSLKTDVLLCEIDSIDAEADVGATLGRVALSGVAVGLLFRNKYNGFKGRAVGAALVDYAARGAETNDFYNVRIVFQDTTAIQMRMNAQEWGKIEEIVGAGIFSESHRAWALSYLDLVDRLCADGEKALAELEEELHEVNARVAATELHVASGETFKIRDACRAQLASIKEEREILLLKIKNVQWSLARRRLTKSVDSSHIQIEHAERSKTSIASGLKKALLVILVLLGMLVYLVVYPLLESRSGVHRSPAETAEVFGQGLHGDTIGKLEVVQNNSGQKINPAGCNSDLSLVEQLICSNDDLAQMDRHLADVFDRARQKEKDDAKFLHEAENSLQELNECRDKSCIMKWMVERERYLLSVTDNQ